MTINVMAQKIGLRLLAGEQGVHNTVSGCYIGDLLSWVMSRAQSGDIWLTVMGNVNAVAVAALTDAAGIVLVENATLDEEARLKADEQDIPIYICEANSYEMALQVHEMLEL